MKVYETPKALKKYVSAHRKKRKWLTAVTCLAAGVVFCTTYALILPAITLENNQTLDCAYVLHQHEAGCYDAEGNLSCGYADYAVHTHQEDYCYDGDGNLICELAQLEVHEHDDSCYQEDSVLVCGETENEGHQHSEDCYTSVQGDLICENEDETHEHTDECYEWSQELTCGMKEGEGAH